jgi:Peptidase family M23
MGNLLYERIMTAVVHSAMRGCYVFAENETPWWLEFEEMEEEERNLPEILIDPDEKTLAITNSLSYSRMCMVSVEKIKCLDESGGLLIDNNGCYTFICAMPPKSILTVCKLSGNLRKIQLDSHFSDIPIDLGSILKTRDHKNAVELECFPLEFSKRAEFLCTQSSMGVFTHFQHPSTVNAVDFRCPIGTEVLAVCDGTVIAAGGNNGSLVETGGIRVSNLFSWNQVVLESDDGVIFEYVHIHHEGIRVKPGDRVNKGQILCLSGNSGFCPEPHLHIEAHKKGEEINDSLHLIWKGFEFIAGNSYP